MSPLRTDLYLKTVDLRRYCPRGEDAPRIDEPGRTCLDTCPLMSAAQIGACRTVLEAASYLPDEPPITVPQPIEPGLVGFNEPGRDALVLVSGNSRVTFEVLAAVWSQGVTPAHLLLVDCLGHTVDMAMVFGEFTAMRLLRAIEESELESRTDGRRLLVPGLTAPLAAEFAQGTGWDIEVGPVCAAELPLFLRDRWMPA